MPLVDFRRSFATLAAVGFSAVGLATPVFGQADPTVYLGTSETTTRYNVNGSTTIGGLDATCYANVYVANAGVGQFRLNSLSVGIRRVGTATAPAPAIGVEVTVVEMVLNGTTLDRGETVATFTQALPAVTTSVTTPVSFTWGATDPSQRPVIDLYTANQGVNGYGAFWVGVKFTGTDAANAANGWRVVNEPGPGRSVNNFGVYNAATGDWAPNYWFGTTTGTDGVVRDNPARFMVTVAGAPVNGEPTPPDLLYGRSFEHTTYFKPPDAFDGTGSRWVYTNCFVPASAGDVLTPNKIVYGILRGGSATTPAPAVGVELALVRMDWNGTAYAPGETIASQTFALDAATTVFTERLEWTFPKPASRPEIPLNTDNAANAGLGGYYVAARMLGDATALAGNNGPRIVYGPLFGASANVFGMLSDTGVFTSYNFGTYSNSTTTLYLPKPARFLAETFGEVGPPAPSCPADIDGDGEVSASDLSTLLGSWGVCGAKCPADIDGDGEVSASDLSTLLGAWGPCS
jgi:hypothetical protein